MSDSQTDPGPRLDAHVPLQRAGHVRLELDGAGRVRVQWPDGDYRVVPHGLEILSRFTTPTSAAEALATVAFSGARDWVAARDAIRDLWLAGLIQEPGRPAHLPAGRGYEGTTVHALMLNDRGRTAGFVRAVEAAVRPGDVVVDIGTGTGILALAAARAGARRVFAIESSSMADTAAAVFAANGFADRITVLRGTSSAVTLPEPADVIVAELLGHHPLDEGLLPVIADARRRHARPGARIVPRRLSVLAQPIQIPDEELARREASPLAVARWREWYGFDLSPVSRRPTASRFSVLPEGAASWATLAPPAAVFDIDLETAVVVPETVQSSVLVAASREGTVNGVLLAMRAELCDSVVIETLPGRAAADNCWKCPVWLLREPFVVETGAPVVVEFSHGEARHGGGEYAGAHPEATSAPPGVALVASEGLAAPNHVPVALSPSTRVSRAPDLLSAAFAEECVAAPLSGPAIVFEGTGASIWNHLETPVTIADVCRALAQEFDIEPAECEGDVLAFLEDLEARGLIRLDGGSLD